MKKSVGYCRRCVLSAILCVGSERNHSNGSAGAKPVRNPEREKPKWEDTAGYLMDGDEMGFDADVMLLAMMLQEMKNEDVRKVTIEQVKVLARLNKEA